MFRPNDALIAYQFYNWWFALLTRSERNTRRGRLPIAPTRHFIMTQN